MSYKRSSSMGAYRGVVETGNVNEYVVDPRPSRLASVLVSLFALLLVIAIFVGLGYYLVAG